MNKEVVFKSINKPKQLVYGVVLAPNVEDSQGDVIEAEDIEKTAHDYLVQSRVIGNRHIKEKGSIVKADAELVESFISPCDMLIGESQVSKGSWVIAVKVNDSEMWADIERDELTGFSIGGFGIREEMNGDETNQH